MALTVIDVVVLLACLLLARQVLDGYDTVVGWQRDADRLSDQEDHLWERAVVLHHPANEVFEDRMIAYHREHTHRDLLEFERVWAELRQGSSERLKTDLDDIAAQVHLLVTHADTVFLELESGHERLASQAMARMDRQVAGVQTAFRDLRRHDAAEHAARIDSLQLRMRALTGIQYLLGAVVLVVVLLAAVTGRRELLAIQADAADRERWFRDLETARLASDAANRAKSDFLANMSHEIRTPMTAILGYADLLLDVHQAPSDRLDCVQTIRRNGGHLLQIVNDILDLSKIEAGKLEVEQIPTDPAQVVAEVLSLMQVRAAEKSLAFDTVFATELPTSITSDPTRVRQVLLNLVGNAIKFTDRGGVRLVGRCDFQAQRLEFEVTDTGPGMDAATLARLFQPFTQADTSTTRQFGGTGLGLTISRRLAQMLGGEIEVTSTPGRGSSFRFHLKTGPLGAVGRTSSPVQRVALPGTAPATRLSGRILLAEDGPDNQRLVCALLRMAGADVDVAENGRVAVDLALAALDEGRPYGVVLMDMQMPVLDGYGATALLRAREYRLPIIALTAHAMAGDRDKCLQAGCDDHATKPVDRVALIETVARWLGQVEQAPAFAPATDVAPVPPASEDDAPLYSVYATDPDMAALVSEFAVALPERIEELQQVAERGEVARLGLLAHQLKGAAGAYGYAVVTDVARDLELAVQHGADPTDHLARLRVLGRRVEAALAA